MLQAIVGKQARAKPGEGHFPVCFSKEKIVRGESNFYKRTIKNIG
jgi:hypothetical protein